MAAETDRASSRFFSEDLLRLFVAACSFVVTFCLVWCAVLLRAELVSGSRSDSLGRVHSSCGMLISGAGEDNRFRDYFRGPHGLSQEPILKLLLAPRRCSRA